MTRKFKVGDWVTITGTVVKVDRTTGDRLPYLVYLDEPDIADNMTWFSEASLAPLPVTEVGDAD